MNIPEFSVRELAVLDNIVESALKENTLFKRNNKLGLSLQNACTRLNIELFDYMKYKARQSLGNREEPTPEPSIAVKNCLTCTKKLTGKQEKHCSESCKSKYYQNQKQQFP